MREKNREVAGGGEGQKSDQSSRDTAPEAGKDTAPDLSTPNSAVCAGAPWKDCRKEPRARPAPTGHPNASGCNAPFQGQASRSHVVSFAARPAKNNEGINKQSCRSQGNCARSPAQSCLEVVRE